MLLHQLHMHRLRGLGTCILILCDFNSLTTTKLPLSLMHPYKGMRSSLPVLFCGWITLVTLMLHKHNYSHTCTHTHTHTHTHIPHTHTFSLTQIYIHTHIFILPCTHIPQPPRDANPVLLFNTTDLPPLLVENFPFDKYELEPSPLTQYILGRRNPSICWQVR